MSSRRTSGRSSRSVDYSKFANASDSDDAFENSTSPSRKKAKKDSATKKEKLSTTEKTSRKQPKLRASSQQEEKFEEELGLALKLSLAATENKPIDNFESKTKSVTTKAQICPTERTEQKENINPVKVNSILTSEQGAICNVQDDITEITSSLEERKSRRKRTKDENSNEEEYVASDEEKSSDDETFQADDTDDSDFEEEIVNKPKVKEKKVPVRTKKAKKETAPVSKIECTKPNTTARTPLQLKKTTACSKTPALKQSGSLTSTAHHATTLSKCRNQVSPVMKFKQPSWNPPGVAGSPSNQKLGVPTSPSSLRIGLSRNVRLKPLHTNFTK